MGPGRTPGEKTACMYKIVVKSQLHRRSKSRAACQPRGNSVKKFGLYFHLRGKSLLSITCEPNRSGRRDPGLGSKQNVNRVRATDGLWSSCSAFDRYEIDESSSAPGGRTRSNFGC